MDYTNIIITCNCIIEMIEETKKVFSQRLPEIIQELMDEKKCSPEKIDLISEGFEAGVNLASTTYQIAIDTLVKTLKNRGEKINDN